jgi:GT2 family glycosyltransferase
MDLSIIIVNWNSADFVIRCVSSIQRETKNLDYEIIVADSGSFDDCGARLKREFPRVTFVQIPENMGFARSNNTAFTAAHGKCILFLNPDTELVGPAINTMYERLQTLTNAGVIGCKLLNTDLSIQTSCVQSFPTILNQILDAEPLRSKWPSSRLWGMAALYTSTDQPAAVEAISGAAVMLKRSVFEQVGLFSEDYFMYAEDIDLSYKVKKAGFTNYYIPQARIVHFGGASSQQTPNNFSIVMMRESIWRFLRKSRGRTYGLGYRWAMLLSAVVRLILLGVMLPVRCIRLQPRTPDGALQKWWAVLRWSLMRQQWLKQY